MARNSVVTAASAPALEDIARIAAVEDPVLRNLQITHCYHRLSEALAGRLGREANWCTSATWASKQAGSTIRREDLTRSLEERLGGAEVPGGVEGFVLAVRRFGVRLKKQRLAELLWQTLDLPGAFAHSSEAVARGNLKVFAEIGREFARFIDMCLEDESPDPQHLEAFIQGLTPGPPPNGQDYLRQAFANIYAAAFEVDQDARSELMLLANLQIGFHEQTRLQPDIVEALEAPVLSPGPFTRNLLNAYYPGNPWVAGAIHKFLSFAGRLINFDGFIADYLAGARRQAQNIVTRTMMSIEIPPHHLLRLGEDLTGIFPAELRQIRNLELSALLEDIDPTPNSLESSGTAYWGDLPDRLHFIADLFRSFHRAGGLFDPPFSPEQTQSILSGTVPDGRL